MARRGAIQDGGHSSMAVTKKVGKGRWAIWLLLAIIAGMSWVSWKWFQLNEPLLTSFQPLEAAATQIANRDVVGDLGGITVTIPQHFANYVEYDGDPGWGENRKGPRPVRTHQSKLRSFGFHVRYPDMAGLSSPVLRQDKARYTIYNTPWISVGINTGSIYPGDDFLDRWTHARVETPNYILKFMNYERLPGDEHGLTVYAPAGIDPKTQKPYRQDDHAEDVFIHRDDSGRVDATIQCSNVGHAAAPCTHNFSLGPKAKGQIYVLYRRSLLPEWRGIQDSVRKLILSFETQPPATNDATKSGDKARKR
jgi:hypothetical protein